MEVIFVFDLIVEDMKSTEDESGPSPQNILHDEITTDNTQQSTAEGNCHEKRKWH